MTEINKCCLRFNMYVGLKLQPNPRTSGAHHSLASHADAPWASHAFLLCSWGGTRDESPQSVCVGANPYWAPYREPITPGLLRIHLRPKLRAWSGYGEAVRARNSQGVKVRVDIHTANVHPNLAVVLLFVRTEVE